MGRLTEIVTEMTLGLAARPRPGRAAAAWHTRTPAGRPVH